MFYNEINSAEIFPDYGSAKIIPLKIQLFQPCVSPPHIHFTYLVPSI